MTQANQAAQLFLEDLYIKDQVAWHRFKTLEEVYSVINENVQKLEQFIDKYGFVYPSQFGTKAAHYFYVLMVHADFHKELQKEYLVWLRKNKLEELDMYNLERRIKELKNPVNMGPAEFRAWQKQRFGQPVIFAPYFAEHPRMRGFYTTKTLGNLSFKYAKDKSSVVLAAIRLKHYLFRAQNKKLLTFSLQNKDNIIEFSAEDIGAAFNNYQFELTTHTYLQQYGLVGDALIVPFADIVQLNIGGVGTDVGDCFILSMWNKQKTVFAQVHLGVPGFTLGLLHKLIDKLRTKYGVDPADLYVLWGPGIHKDFYIYTDISRFKDHPLWQGFIIPEEQNGKTVYHMDLLGAIRNSLLNLGIAFDHYRLTPVDTYTNPYLYSHTRSLRTGEPEGRFLEGVVFAD